MVEDESVQQLYITDVKAGGLAFAKGLLLLFCPPNYPLCLFLLSRRLVLSLALMGVIAVPHSVT